MNFPDWAPPKLVEHYQAFYAEPDPNWYRALARESMISIITNPEMKSVWKMLYQKRTCKPCDDHKPASFGDDLMAYFLFQAILSAIVETKRKITTRREDVLKYQEIAKTARELAEKVSRSSLDISPMHWFPDEAINTILEKDIKAEKAEGYFCLTHDESEYHKKGGIYTEFRAKDLSGNDICEYWRISENTREFFNDYVITPRYPSLSAILKSMAAEADTAAKHEATRSRIASKSTIYPKTIFIRALYPFWLENFGSPLYRTFATLCRVVLNDDNINEGDVKDALKNYKISI